MTLTKSSAVPVSSWNIVNLHGCRGNMTNGTMIYAAIDGDVAPAFGDILARTFQEDSPLTAGTESIIDPDYSSNETSLEYLEDDKAVVAWEAGGAIYARVFTLSGTSIGTIGAIQTMVASGASSGYFSLGTLGASGIIICFRDGGNSDYATAVASTISGTTISTPGSETVIESVYTDRFNVAGTSTTGAIVAYMTASTGRACALSISGTTVTAGTPANITGNLESQDVNLIRSHAADAAILLYKPSGANGPYAKILTQSGTTLTQHTAAPLDWASSPTPAALTQGLDICSDTLAIYGYHQDGVLYAGEIVISGTTIDSAPTALAVVSISWESQIGAIGVTSNGKAVIADTVSSDVYLLTSDLVTTPSEGSGVYALALSNDIENDGTKGFLTLWKDGTLYLQKWSLDTLTVDFEIPLGSATLTEVQARTKIAYPFALSDQEAFVYGLMSNPAYLSGTVQLLKTTTGGGSGTWSDQSPGDWDSSHILAGFYAGENSGAGRPWYGVRCTTGTAPRFFYGLDSLADVSAIPLQAGTIIRHGAFHISRRESAVVGADYGTGSTVYEADPYWNSWVDFTYDHPSGSHSVLRFL